jgi:PAP2 superfamily protein
MAVLEGSVVIAKEPTAPARSVRFLRASACYLLFIGLSELLKQTPLPYDQNYYRVIYLMWSAGTILSRPANVLWAFTPILCQAGLALVLVGALFPRGNFPRPVTYLIGLAYRYAIAFPLFVFLMSNLSRLTSNLEYALTARIRWDLTPLLGKIETPFIQGVQHSLYSPALSWVCYFMYSTVWSVPLLLSGIFLVAIDRPRAVNKLIAGYFLVSILAVPFFVLLPVFDPWTTNPIYSNPGAWHSGILYLYPNPNLYWLRFTNSNQFKWSTGSCLPSLHVAIPLMLFWVLRKERFPRLAACYLILAVATAFTVVYLGRHWVLDIVAAVPFAYGVAKLCERSTLDFTLV